MSYILEALRRAERERDTGKAPSVESLSRSSVDIERGRVPLSVWALAIATAVIACTALVILLWPHAVPAPAPARDAHADTVPATITASEPAAFAVSAARNPELPMAPASVIEDHDEVVSLDDVTGDDTEPSPSADAGSMVDATAAPLQPEDTAAAAPAAVAQAPDPTPIVAGTGVDRGTVVVPAGVTVLREMPERYREQFPVHAFDVHVYDPDPAKRWVMIDGKRYQEGNTLASGARIVEIVAAGAVFEYQGAKVLLPVR